MILQMLLLGIEYDITTNEIISKSKDLIIKSGLNKTSMQDIAIACEKDESFINKYFKNKSTLVDAIFEKELRNLNKQISLKVNKENGFFNKIKTYCKLFSDEFVRLNELYEVAQKETYNNYNYKKYLLRINQNEVSYIEGLLKYGLESGELKDVGKEKVELFISLFLGSLLYSIEIYGVYRQKYLEEINNLISKVFC